MEIRSIVFISLFIVFHLLQWLWPSRKMYKGRFWHMTSNLLMVIINNLILFIIPIVPLSASVYARDRHFGVFNILNQDNGFELFYIVIGIILLDFVIYFQHRFFHTNDFLWRFHKVHHIDPMIDVTTALRFHPIEIIISNIIKVIFIMILGVAPLGVLLFEIILNGLAMFNHMNVRFSNRIEALLRKVLITPSLHTIHHSKIFTETNSNYGFSVVYWDKLFSTYKDKGKYPMDRIHIGTVPMPDVNKTGFPYYLVFPFIKESESKAS